MKKKRIPDRPKYAKPSYWPPLYFRVGRNNDHDPFSIFIGLKKLFKLKEKYPYPPPNPSSGGISK